MCKINFELKSSLLERGFVVTNENTVRMECAQGSIANYQKCTITLGHKVWGDIAKEWFYSVRYESFMESGQPEVDHHTIKECYIAESKVADFMKDKCFLTRAEHNAKVEERVKRLREMRAKRMMERG